MFSIEFKQSVQKDLQKIEKQFTKKIFAAVDKLKINPYKQNIKKLAGSTMYFRIRIGDYRIIFQILDSEKIIVIHYIRHRKDVYRNL